ncbi:winged helix-turn-helix domain-containing protein [Streptomyces sp. SID10815]|uniref:winged helix-turn-helix domain-containing protein n=1 Tax=Streptomyces sp. SID10815 TaxID=2706027 RepID=UPI0013C87CEE|nr:winged helix-turn-helix domain-containing protein [Streptomyces sp. SID10815]NEA49212.1 winged helix-turn-helix transcriptional regulator [Streptomyces sp. SID10815]
MTETSPVDHDMWRQCISRDLRVKQNTYAVAMAFSMFGDYTDGTDVFPSMARIAAMVGLSNATKVHPHRRKLVECGYLADTRRRSAADTVVYRLTAPAEVVAAVKAGREARAPRKPKNGPSRAAIAASGPSAPSAVDQPSTGASGPLELTLEQKAWFLGGNDPQSWPWADIPYAQAEDAYRSYTGQTAA